jgi:glyoxylase-like metal-dependent hydrolase (beta-lactamase superfamily II)
MSVSKVYPISNDLDLIDLMPSIPGFENFLGTYVLRSERIALVDVGPSSCVLSLLEGLGELDIKPEEISYIFITHIHLDHAGGVGTLIKYMPQAKVIVHERGKPHLIDPQKLWESSKLALGELAEMYGEIEPVPSERLLVAEEGMIIDLWEGTVVEALVTLGHAPHHLSFWERKENRLFGGEAAGVYSQGIIRPATPPPFNLEQELASVDKLIQLSPSSLCYSHFGCAGEAPQKLRLHQQQLILWSEIIAAALLNGASTEEIYAEINERDELLIPLKTLSENQYQRERNFILNSIAGFIDYFKRFGIPKAVP